MVDARTLQKPDYNIYPSASEFQLHKNGSDQVLRIRRDTGEIIVEEKTGEFQARGIDCYGLMGILSLKATKYLIVITQARFIGKIHLSYIYRVEAVDFISYASPSHLAASSNKSVDDYYISMIQKTIDTKTFYFAYDYDLTHNLQRISGFNEFQKGLKHWERAEYKFHWNHNMSEELIKIQAHDWILPIMNGFIQIESTQFDGHDLEYILISRRDHRRTGARYCRRGLDKQGHSVNFAETEQIIVYTHNNKTTMCSYVQTRGSIPLLWHQKVDLSYMPKGRIIGNSEENATSAKLHFNELMEVYGDQALVNLVDKKGNQKEMGQAFSDLVDTLKLDRIKQYVWFDFHSECKKMQWQNLSRLVKLVERNLDEFNFFRMSIDITGEWGDEVSHESQVGAFRTNCMDSLDRTNVVQSVFARNLLHRQLHALGILGTPNEDPFCPFPEPLESVFRDFWVNNANTMSVMYSGTDALKKDFTKYGKRTFRGVYDDGLNSGIRYILNNFYDGARQDTVDIFLGNIDPFKNDKRQKPGVSVPLTLLLVALFFIYFGSSFLVGDGILWWITVFSLLFLLTKIKKPFGSKLVNKPTIDS